MPLVYKVTYPNGKIYVGSDMTDIFSYLGSPSAKMWIRADLTREQYLDLTIRKQILWESASATRRELVKKENEFIVSLRANDPAIGYNLAPPFVLPSNNRQD
jgi:hypothetical protein